MLSGLSEQKRKSIAEILSLMREQVRLGIWENEEEGIREYKLKREKKWD